MKINISRLRSNNETEMLLLGNEVLSFHIKIMESSWLTKQIVEFYENRSMVKTETMKLISTIKEDLNVADRTLIDNTVWKTVKHKIVD